MRETADRPKAPSLLGRLVAFLVTLILVLGAVALVANWDKLNMDAIKRYFAYHSVKRNDSGQIEPFTFTDNNHNQFAPLDDGLVVCAPDSIRLYSSSGTVYLDEAVSLEHPVVSSTGDTVLAYDAGGQNLFVFAKEQEVFSLDLDPDSGQSILSAQLNDSGWLAVTTQESGHKGAVTVYNSGFEKKLQIMLSSSFITDAAVSPDNQSVAVVTVGLGVDGAFESRINFYQLDRTEEEIAPDFSCSVGNNVSLGLRWKSDGIWFLGENSLTIVGEDGGILGNYSYTGRYLKTFTLDGEGYAVLLLGKYRAGSVADLVLIDATGNVAATCSMTDQVLSLSSAGKYTSVLTAGKLSIYNQELQAYNILESTQGARRAIQRTDGSVMLIASKSARLYLPS